ncbi:MAG: prepilin-type N-terminal cleavage/methylation domain-containing protein [Gaiellaceae bacterium]
MTRRAPLLRDRSGFTLVELLAVLAIFLVIVTALTTLFVSGSKAELDANHRFQAQQNARVALDQLRRELHCSSGLTNTDGSALTATPVSAIRVALPSHCPTAVVGTTTVDYQAVANGSGRWKLLRVQGGSSIPIADYLVEDEVFTYTAPSADTRALLHVDFPVNVNPNEGWKTWRLVDDIVLRNTLRQDP